MKNDLVVKKLIAKHGKKVQGFIEIDEENLKLPMTLINGSQEGKTILLTAGVHGCEYPAIKTVIELAKEINPNEIHGQLILIHLVNPSGFFKRTPALVPEDEKNLLRVFPGKQEGTLSEKIAYFITHEILPQVDVYFDLHGGDVHEDLLPHLYYPGAALKEVVQSSIELAQYFNVPYYVKSNLKNGTYTSAAINGVPSLLIERGSCGLCEEDVVSAYKKDLINVLAALKIMAREVRPNTFKPIEIKKAIYLTAHSEGCWTCFVKIGQFVKAGELLGEVTDYFGKVIDTYIAQMDGVILYHTVAYSIEQGSSLVAYGSY